MRSPRPMLSIFLTVVIDLLGFGIVLPLLPLYADEWKAAPAVIALLFTSFSALQFVSAPLWGRLSDRIDRRLVITGSHGVLSSSSHPPIPCAAFVHTNANVHAAPGTGQRHARECYMLKRSG